MVYKMIYSDLDGTLLNSKKEISKVNRDVISKLDEKGIIFGIATGRIYPAAKMYSKELNLNSPIICCNGALVVDPRNGHAVISNTIENSKVKEIISIIKKYDVYFHFYTIDTIYAEEEKYIVKKGDQRWTLRIGKSMYRLYPYAEWKKHKKRGLPRAKIVAIHPHKL